MRVYFDLDGTLIDSTKRHAVLLQRILDNQKIEIQKNVIDKYLQYKCDGGNTKGFLINVLGLEKKEAEEICRIWIKDIEKEEYLDMDILYPESMDVLGYLKRRNIQIFYISARANYNGVMKELIRLGINTFPDNIYIVNTVNAAENKYICLKPRIRESDIIVGDTEVDYYLAVKLNVGSIMLNRGFRSKKFWDNKGVKSYGEMFSEIKRIINYYRPQ